MSTPPKLNPTPDTCEVHNFRPRRFHYLVSAMSKAFFAPPSCCLCNKPDDDLQLSRRCRKCFGKAHGFGICNERPFLVDAAPPVTKPEVPPAKRRRLNFAKHLHHLRHGSGDDSGDVSSMAVSEDVTPASNLPELLHKQSNGKNVAVDRRESDSSLDHCVEEECVDARDEAASSTAKPGDDKLPGSKIKHVVVLMLENRSFDSMLGYLYESKDLQKNIKFVGSRNKKPFDGVDPERMTNEAIMKDGKRIVARPVKNTNDPRRPDGNPGEYHYPHTSAQFYLSPPPNASFEEVKELFAKAQVDWTQTPSMSGFLQDFTLLHPDKTEQQVSEYMSCYGEQLAPVLNLLARNYAVCDEWFASVPSQTWPNRLFTLFGTAFGIIHNQTRTQCVAAITRIWQQNRDSFFEKLSAARPEKFSWTVYAHSLACCMSYMFLQGSTLNGHLMNGQQDEAIKTIEQFKEDAKNGQLPSFSFIEPLYEPAVPNTSHFFFKTYVPKSHNDQHPHHEYGFSYRPTMREGEQLILDLYESLFVTGKNAEETLLIVTYDESGGCFDHVPPPAASKPGDNIRHNLGPEQSSFDFDRLGIRVPCIFVSPQIAKNTVLRSRTNAPFSHTSIAKSMRVQLGVEEPLSKREDESPDFWHVFNADKPRTDAAEIFNEIKSKMLPDEGFEDIAKVTRELEQSEPTDLSMTMMHGAATMVDMSNGKTSKQIVEESDKHVAPTTMSGFFSEMGNLYSQIVKITNLDVTQLLSDLTVSDVVEEKVEEAPIKITNKTTD